MTNKGLCKAKTLRERDSVQQERLHSGESLGYDGEKLRKENLSISRTVTEQLAA